MLAFGFGVAAKALPCGLTGQDSTARHASTYSATRAPIDTRLRSRCNHPTLSSICSPDTGALSGRSTTRHLTRGRSCLGYRVRFQPRLSRGAGSVGSAVRRFRRPGAEGAHRSTSSSARGRGQVGPAREDRGAAAASRLRGPGAGTFQRAHGAVPAARRGRQHADLPALERRGSPTCRGVKRAGRASR